MNAKANDEFAIKVTITPDRTKPMSINEYRARSTRDRKIRDGLARATGPGLLDMIESGQRLNNPNGIYYRDMNNYEVYMLVRIIDDYRALMHKDGNEAEFDRAEAALACGHGYFLKDSCPGCQNNADPYPGCLPLIALVPTPKGCSGCRDGIDAGATCAVCHITREEI